MRRITAKQFKEYVACNQQGVSNLETEPEISTSQNLMYYHTVCSWLWRHEKTTWLCAALVSGLYYRPLKTKKHTQYDEHIIYTCRSTYIGTALRSTWKLRVSDESHSSRLPYINDYWLACRHKTDKLAQYWTFQLVCVISDFRRAVNETFAVLGY
jgi:hypothetical protein